MFIYSSYIPKLCLYEMKRRDHISEKVRKQNNVSMNIIYIPKEGAVCERDEFIKYNPK